MTNSEEYLNFKYFLLKEDNTNTDNNVCIVYILGSNKSMNHVALPTSGVSGLGEKDQGSYFYADGVLRTTPLF
jgi:hypothetical protein